PGVVDLDPVKPGVAPREVDPLERAGRGVRFEHLFAVQAVVVGHQQLTRTHVAEVLRTDDGQSGGFGGEHPATIEGTDDQRPDAVAVAQRDDATAIHYHYREAALELAHGPRRGLAQVEMGAARAELEHHRAAAGRLETCDPASQS